MVSTTDSPAVWDFPSPEELLCSGTSGTAEATPGSLVLWTRRKPYRPEQESQITASRADSLKYKDFLEGVIAIGCRDTCHLSH